MLTKTYILNTKDVEKKWHLIDATDQVLGRLATKVACLLMGKGKVTYTPHIDGGDYVVIINAKKIRITGNKAKDKIYTHYTGYSAGLRQYNFETLFAKKPTEVIVRAVERMLPKNKLGTQMMKHLHVYPDGTHEQQAQNPVPLK